MFKALFILNGGGYGGYSGYSGYSHESSYSGYSGTSSYSGYSGTSNYSGYSGQGNYSGYSGTPGYSGTAEDHSSTYSTTATSGLYNSARFIVDALIAAGKEAKISFAVSVDSIPELVAEYGATHIFIEGLWVQPEDFRRIVQNQGTRKWHVRIHSEIPFLASENIAIDWTVQYIKNGIAVVANAQRAQQQIEWLAKQLTPEIEATQLTPLLPNCYPTEFLKINLVNDPHVINIGCFGAFRPLKNHLQQAFIAVRYAQQLGKPLRYHINFKDGQQEFADFINVKSLISAAGAELVLHDWADRDKFLEVLGQMDVLLQVSMSETFNIVAADATLAGIPILISSEIPWAYPVYADPQEIDESIKKLKLIMSSKTFFIQQNREGIRRHTKRALEEWIHYLES